MSYLANFTHNVVFISVLEILACGGGGLRNILVDSDVYAYASVDQMFSGKQYKKALREFWCLSLCSGNRKPILSVDNFGISSLMYKFLWGNNMDIHEEVLELI